MLTRGFNKRNLLQDLNVCRLRSTCDKATLIISDSFDILPTWLTISGHFVFGVRTFFGASEVVVRRDYKLVGAMLPRN